MPSLNENLENWSRQWDWSHEGDEWSQWWGGTPALWFGALLPRLHAFLPAGTILEIAPGYGRWTQYLKDLCERLIAVDMTPNCIEHCRARFADCTNIEYHVNDGRSLEMVPDGAVDLAFSFDSLVHADAEVVGGYLQQLAGKLSADGVGFIHHSNAGSLKPLNAMTRRVPDRFYRRLVRTGVAVNLTAWRDESVTAAEIRRRCEEAGLACVTQELISWEHGGYTIDALTTFTRAGSRWARAPRVVRNPAFVLEAKRMARLYAAPSFLTP